MKQLRNVSAIEKTDLEMEVQEYFQGADQRLIRLEGQPPQQMGPLALEFWNHRTGWEAHLEADWYNWMALDNLQYVIAKGQREVFIYSPYEKSKIPLIEMDPVKYPGPYDLTGNWMFAFARLSERRWLLSAPISEAAADGDECWMELTLRDESGSVLDRLHWPRRSKAKEHVPKQLCNFNFQLALQGKVLIAMEQSLCIAVGIYEDKLAFIGKEKFPKGVSMHGNGSQIWLEQDSGNQKNRWFELGGFQEMWETGKDQ